MAIVYDPSKMLRKIAPASKIEKLLSKDLTVKKAALSFIDEIDFISKKEVTRVALKTVKAYRERLKLERAAGGSVGELKEEIRDDPRLLVNRVQNEVVTQVADEIKTKYEGEFYEWLPSDAEEPDPEHQLNYGEKFQVGVGEMPGDRFGCRCGMRILVAGEELEL